MRIRSAVPQDAEAIRDVHYRSIRGLGTRSYSQAQVDAWAKGCESADYSSSIEGEVVEFVVAEIDDDIVGFGSLKLDSPDGYESRAEAEVTGVYVHPSVSRRGIGTSLYEALERRARTHDVRTLGLSASLNAVPFYEARGFERVREYTHEFSNHVSTGVTGTVVEMAKEL